MSEILHIHCLSSTLEHFFCFVSTFAPFVWLTVLLVVVTMWHSGAPEMSSCTPMESLVLVLWLCLGFQRHFFLWTFPRWTSSLGKVLLVATGAPQFEMIPVLFWTSQNAKVILSPCSTFVQKLSRKVAALVFAVITVKSGIICNFLHLVPLMHCNPAVICRRSAWSPKKIQQWIWTFATVQVGLRMKLLKT